jgi:hypothetical protein
MTQSEKMEIITIVEQSNLGVKATLQQVRYQPLYLL